jgi:antitoxin MazE
MQVQLKSWGNSQGIRLSKECLKAAGFQPDEVLNAEVSDGKIVLSRSFRHRSLKERAEAYGGKLNLSEEIDWGEPAGDEVW